MSKVVTRTKQPSKALLHLHEKLVSDELSLQIISKRVADAKEMMLKLFQQEGLNAVTTKEGTSYLARSQTRATKVIDVKDYQKKLNNDDAFYQSVKVAAGEAAKLLSKKELEAITTEIPAKLGDLVVEVTVNLQKKV